MKLILDLILQVFRLLGGEMALARAEMAWRLRRAARGAMLLLVAVIFGCLALAMLAGGLVALGQSYGLSPVQAFLAVSGGFGLVALLLGWLGVRSLRPKSLIPRQSLASLRRDFEILTRKEKP